MADDDEVPLLTLAKKQPKIDDNQPLASLVSAGGSKSGRPAAAGGGAKPGAAAKPGRPSNVRPPAASPQGGAAAPGKGKGKGPLKRPKRSESSSSSSSSSSSDSAVGDKPQKGTMNPMKAALLRAKKAKLLQRKAEEEEVIDHGGAVKKKDRQPKEEAVAQLLCRWWYSLPDWPPQEESYYQEKLRAEGCKKVRIEEWEWLPEVDDKGLKKVYELSQFRGVYRKANGELLDLRPQETCPCYANLIKWDMAKLYKCLVQALEKQLEDLKNSKYNETKIESQIKADLGKYRDKLQSAIALRPGSVAGK